MIWRMLYMLRGRFPALVLFFGAVALIFIAAVSWAQAPLQIARPVDGATVREIVNILVPTACVPEGGFISCTIDGKFKVAASSRSEDNRYFVYRWDSKVMERSPETGAELGRPSDGKHIISVQVYDKDGLKVGDSEEIEVYLKNSAAADMPAAGLKLRYAYKRGTASNYAFKNTIDLLSIKGATNLTGAMGRGVEGAEGLVKRSVEDILPEGAALIRQKLVGNYMVYQGGQPVAANLTAKAVYNAEDSLGHMTYVMPSSSPGAGISLDMPNLPVQAVRIGDSWTIKDKILRDPITGNSVVLTATSQLDGLEWEGGHPCAKIATTFSGTARIPFSSLMSEAIPVSGHMVTYFAYRVGKVISSSTEITTEPSLTQSVASNLTKAMTEKAGAMDPLGSYQTSAFGGGFDGQGGSSREETVKVKLRIRQSMGLVP